MSYDMDGVEFYANGLSVKDSRRLVQLCREGVFDDKFTVPEMESVDKQDDSSLTGVEIAEKITNMDVAGPLHLVMYETSGSDSDPNFTPFDIEGYIPPSVNNMRAALSILRRNSKAYYFKQKAAEDSRKQMEKEKAEYLEEEKVMGVRLFEASMGFVTRERADQSAKATLGDFEQQISNAFDLCKDYPRVKEELTRWLGMEMHVKQMLMDVIEKTGLRSACVTYREEEVERIKSVRPPSNEIDPRLDIVPMTKAPLAAMVTEQGDHPVAFNVVDPEGMMPSMCVTPNTIMNVGCSGHTSMNFVANMNAYWDACTELANVEGGVFRRRIEKNNPYIIVVDVPRPCFSRVNLRNIYGVSATVNQQMMSGIKAVPVCAKLTMTSMKELPETQIPGLPRITCGSTSVQMYTVLNGIAGGREYLDAVNDQFMQGRKVVDMKNYDDYVQSVMNVTKLGVRARSVPLKDQMVYLEDVNRYLKPANDGSTSIMQVLADDRGLATNIQAELAVIPSCAFYIWKLIHDRYPSKSVNGSPINGTFYQARALYRYLEIKPTIADRADIMGIDTNMKVHAEDDVGIAVEVVYEWKDDICVFKGTKRVEGPLMIDLTIPCKRYQSTGIRKIIAGKKNTKGLHYKTDHDGARSIYNSIKDDVDFAVFYVSYYEINSAWFCSVAKKFEVSVVPTAVNVLYGTYFAFERRPEGYRMARSEMSDLCTRVMGYASQKFAMMKTLVTSVFEDISLVHDTYARLWGNDSLVKSLRKKISVRNYPAKLGKAQVKGDNPIHAPITGVYDLMKMASTIDFGRMQFEGDEEMVIVDIPTTKKEEG